jgi:hypothetical protein
MPFIGRCDHSLHPSQRALTRFVWPVDQMADARPNTVQFVSLASSLFQGIGEGGNVFKAIFGAFGQAT